MTSLYLWGNVDFGGSPSSPENPEAPPLEWPVRIPISMGTPVTSISCGSQHCLFIAGGKVYGFGSNKYRQIHHLALDVCDAPTPIQLPPTATGRPLEVCCGKDHSFIRFDDGSVLSAGRNDLSQLGQIHDRHAPHGDDWRGWGRVALPVAATRIVSRGDSSFVLHDGSLFSWGLQKHGHLGHGSTGELERESSGAARFEPIEFPTKVKWFASHHLKIVEIAAGPTHLLARTDNEIYALGDNSYGKLGVQGVSLALTPTRIRLVTAGDAPETLMGIAAGTDASFALTLVPNFGSMVYVWGKQGPDSSCVPTQIAWGVPPEMSRVVAGGDFQLGLSPDGFVRTWGKPKPTYRAPTAMHSAAESRTFPLTVECMRGKFIVDAAIGSCFGVLVADDSKFKPGPTHETSTIHVMVPKASRYGPTSSKEISRYEAAIRKYLTKVVGATRALEIFNEIPVASEVPVATGKVLQKRGAENLGVGSKVRVWVQDVYALGVIIAKDPEGYPAPSFEIRWIREDWDPEVIELRSEDETLDETNENRWQNLWFIQE